MKNVVKHAGKGSRNVLLPNRGAVAQLTGSDDAGRTINDYAKKTPDLGSPTPSILQMGRGARIQ